MWYRYVPDQHKNQKMCNEAILKNGLHQLSSAADNYAHALTFVPDCYKNQKRCNKAVNTYPSTIPFVPEYYKTQEMCDKAVNTCFFLFESVPDWYKTQKKICDRCFWRPFYANILPQ